MKKLLDKIIQEDFVPVYRKLPTRKTAGVTNIRGYDGKSGVYMITERKKGSRKDEIVYIGRSGSNLYKTIIRHFQKWNDQEQNNRISYRSRILKGTHKYEVAVGVTPARTAAKLEKELILMYVPRDNKDKLAFFDENPDAEIIYQYTRMLTHQQAKKMVKLERIINNYEKYSKNKRKKTWKEMWKLLREIRKEKRKN